MMTTPRFLQGAFTFEGHGLAGPVPPIGARGDVHVSLRVVEV